MATTEAGLLPQTRFSIRERLGAGAMGVVYRAVDHERNAEIAVKRLLRLDAEGIFQFKREFRALAGVVHRNLVTLYELVSIDRQWFFTMELVEGVDFHAYVRGRNAPQSVLTLATKPIASDSGTEDTRTITPGGTLVSPPQRNAGARPITEPEAIARVRRSLGELVEGAIALHGRGIVHCDIKPSNVLVERDGRVVLLDFGIAAALAAQTEQPARIIGTPAFMSPEQVCGDPVSEASDWYAAGVMLFEALTGTRPFRGGAEAVMRAKCITDAPRARNFADIPADLDELCARMLARKPADRPTGDEILRLLGAERPREIAAPEDGATPFVGRARQLGLLADALAETRAGRSNVALVHGSSGSGKSTLVEHFLQSADAVVLSGRCHEQESVPYKALDTVIDLLSHRLLELPEPKLRALAPSGAVAALARLFPVLRQVDGLNDSNETADETPDPFAQRRRAIEGLGSILATVTGKRPVIIHLDDVQWGDRDSAVLLAELLRQPSDLRTLVIATYRREEAATSPFVQTFLPTLEDPVEIAVSRLSLGKARDLARLVLPRSCTPEDIDMVARESGGNPMFVVELARHIRSARSALRTDVTLDELLRGRVSELPSSTKALLFSIAVAGRPIAQRMARLAARIPGDGRAEISQLRSARLIRTAGIRDADHVESYHDRIRETVATSLEPQTRRDIHRRLASLLEGAGSGDLETIAAHYEAAGATPRAADYYIQSADRALTALAFDRAAALYERALALDVPPPQTHAALLRKLGDALSCAGRGVHAAAAYRSAASHSMPDEALQLQRLAAERLLLSGHVDEGTEALTTVLEAVGIRLPTTPRRVFTSLVRRRLWIRLRGLGHRLRDRHHVSPATLQRIEVLWSASVGFGMVNNMLGAELQARHLVAAMRAGERRHVARALAVEACYAAATGGSGDTRATELTAQALRLAAVLDDDVAFGYTHGAAGLSAYLGGRFPEARERMEMAEEVISGQTPWLAWELASMQLIQLWALFQCGAIVELQTRVKELLHDAKQRGDAHRIASLSNGLLNFAWLANDQVATARNAAADGMARWSGRGFHLHHYWEMIALTHIDLYAGDAAAALDRVTKAWPSLRRSMFLRMPFVRAEASYLRARAHLAAAAAGLDEARNLRSARSLARGLARQRGWATPLAHAIRAGCAAGRGNDERARAELQQAIGGFEALGMRLYAAAARRRLGGLLAGVEGERIARDASARMRTLGVVCPDHTTRMFLGSVPQRP